MIFFIIFLGILFAASIIYLAYRIEEKGLFRKPLNPLATETFISELNKMTDFHALDWHNQFVATNGVTILLINNDNSAYGGTNKYYIQFDIKNKIGELEKNKFEIHKWEYKALEKLIKEKRNEICLDYSRQSLGYEKTKPKNVVPITSMFFDNLEEFKNLNIKDVENGNKNSR